MSLRTNELGQPIGADLPGWSARPLPPRTAMEGRTCTVEPVDAHRHAADLHAAFSVEGAERNWTYLPYGPFAGLRHFEDWLRETARSDDPLFHAIVDRATGKAMGLASFLRVEPEAGTIEVGHINYAPALQRTPTATEAMHLMMRRVFEELGYRRYEWKCDALNRPSQTAARRLGFTYEGTFRQATVYKGRNRDTAWYSILDREWPAIDRAFTDWLDPDNFDGDGQQRARLGDLIQRERDR